MKIHILHASPSLILTHMTEWMKQKWKDGERNVKVTRRGNVRAYQCWGTYMAGESKF